MIERPEDTGVSNPYALAELIAGRRIKWASIRNRPKLLESIFGVAFDDIFDPSSGSPIFAAFREAWDLPEAPPAYRFPHEPTDANDLTASRRFSEVRNLADLTREIGLADPEALLVDDLKVVAPSRMRVELRWRNEDRTGGFPVPPAILSSIVPQAEHEDGSVGNDWTPPNAQWNDTGDFFKGSAIPFDPVQGSVGNCYLVAAMACVAWAMPYAIPHRRRATGPGQYTNSITIYGDDGTPVEVEVTDRIPVSLVTGEPLYCRSNDANELWPALFEKAYAKWLTGTQGDKPDITQTAGGSVYSAMRRLTGIESWYESTADYSSDDLWDLVRENSRGYRTFNPMATGTTSEMLLAQQGLTYGGTGIVPGHAYSILGWDYESGTKFLILRNPWGLHEPTIGQTAGTSAFYDVSWWRSIDLTDPDGVFGIDAQTFKAYFNYIGGCKE